MPDLGVALGRGRPGLWVSVGGPVGDGINSVIYKVKHWSVYVHDRKLVFVIELVGNEWKSGRVALHHPPHGGAFVSIPCTRQGSWPE